MTVAASTDYETLDDVLCQLGNVPAGRVLLRPLPGTATEADLLAAQRRPRMRLCELIDGTLVEKSLGLHKSALGGALLGELWAHVSGNRLGVLLGGKCLFRMACGNVRIPDVAFIPWGNLPNGVLPDEDICSLVPDFVVQILTPANTPAELTRKYAELFATGTRLIWAIDSTGESAEILTAPTERTPVAAGGTLTGDPVLPGLTVSLRTLLDAVRRPST